MCIERRRFSQTMASEWQTAFVVSHKIPCCAPIAHCRQSLQQKSWKTARLFLQDRDRDQNQMFKTKIKTKTSWSKTKPKTKTFIFVLEAPRDQDPGLEDYITASEQAPRLRLGLIIIIGSVYRKYQNDIRYLKNWYGYRSRYLKYRKIPNTNN